MMTGACHNEARLALPPWVAPLPGWAQEPARALLRRYAELERIVYNSRR
jgi:hypothetical protein